MWELVVFDVLDHVRYGTRAETWIEGRDRTERTRKRTPTGCLDHVLNKKPGWKQIVTRSWDFTHRCSFPDIALAESSIGCVFQELSPDRFRFANDNAVEMFQYLIWGKSGVWPARNDAFTAFVELACKAIGFGGKPTKKRKRNQICWSLKINRFDLLVDNSNLPTWGSDRSEVDASYWWNEMSFVAVSIPFHIDDDDIDVQDGYPLHETKRLQSSGTPIAARCDASRRGTAGGR